MKAYYFNLIINYRSNFFEKHRIKKYKNFATNHASEFLIYISLTLTHQTFFLKFWKNTGNFSALVCKPGYIDAKNKAYFTQNSKQK